MNDDSFIVVKRNKLPTISPSSYHPTDFLEKTKPWRIEKGEIKNCGVRFNVEPKSFRQEHISNLGNPNAPPGREFGFTFEKVGNPFTVFGGISRIEPANGRFNRFNYAAAQLGATGVSKKDFIISNLQEEAGTVNALQQHRDEFLGLNAGNNELIMSKEEGLRRVLAGIEEIGETILEKQTRYNKGDKEEIQKELGRLETIRKDKKLTGKAKKEIAKTIPNFLEAEPVQRILTDIQKIKDIRTSRKIKKAVAAAKAAAEVGAKAGAEFISSAEAKQASKEATPFLESVDKKIGKVEGKLNTLESAETYFNDNIKTELDAIPINKTTMKKEFKTEYPELYNRFRQYNKLLTGKEEFSNSRLKTVAAFKNAILKSFNAIEDQKFKLEHKQQKVSTKKAAIVTPSGSPKQKARKTIILTRSQKAAEGAAESK